MNPIHITINVPDSQPKQLPTATPTVAHHRPVRSQPQSIQAEWVEPEESVGVFTVPQPGVNFEALRSAIAAVCLLSALALGLRMLTAPRPEPTLTQSQVDALLQQERARWTAEQQALGHQRLEAEYQGFRDGVLYGQP